MSQGLLYATARRLTLSAALVVAAAGCTSKPDARATDARATDAGATNADAVNAGTVNAGAPAARTDSGAAAAGADSASSAVVTHSAPPTAQDRRVAVPKTGQTADTNHSGMAVSRSAPKHPR